MPGGGEVFEEVERGERIGTVGEDLGGGGAGEVIAEKSDEALHERAVGIAAEVATAVAELADEPDLRNTAGHAVGIGALFGRQGRPAAGTVHDGGEALLRVFDQQVILDEGVAIGRVHAVRLGAAALAR